MYIKRGNVKIKRIISDLHDAIVDVKIKRIISDLCDAIVDSTIASRKSEIILLIFTLPRFMYIPLLVM